ncbi:MAG: 6-carboxytetrahydropterin synthase QueD [Lachnospiraceae bacterium]|nr:6-carboxytetrahydropterin synthase QueD [Lachnospiraceae bacterium]
MYYLKTEASFDAAHFLQGYEGKCRNLHGHRWRVVAEIKGETLSEAAQTRGMVVDFGDLKAVVKEMCDELDHCLIYEKGSLRDATLAAFREENFRVAEVPFRPTAEHFARYFFEKVRAAGLRPHRVEVYETPSNCAAYEE